MLGDLIGVKFVKGGRDVATGLDCYGLCQEVYRRLGMELFEYDSPECFDCQVLNTVVQEERWRFTKLEKAEPFCLALFMIRPPYETHVGIVLEDLRRFIHTMDKTGCCIEKLTSNIWNKRIRGYYRWNNSK